MILCKVSYSLDDIDMRFTLAGLMRCTAIQLKLLWSRCSVSGSPSGSSVTSSLQVPLQCQRLNTYNPIAIIDRPSLHCDEHKKSMCL